MNNDTVYRKDVEQMLAELGGCDATEEWERGWDEAIDAAMDELRKVKSVDRWIPCSERLPDKDVNPVTRDYYEYPVTIKIDGVADVRYYKFGKGHWWNGPECMDKCVIAWKERPEPWEGE